MTLAPMTPVDTQTVARSKRRLLDPLRSEAHGRSEWDYNRAARGALDTITAAVRDEADASLAIFRGLHMPAWAGPSGRFPIVADGPLLDLLEEETGHAA